MKDLTLSARTAFSTPRYERLPSRVWWLGGLMVAIGIVAFVLMSTKASSDGYLYLFFYSIPANTAISLFPHEPVLIYYGKFANLWLSACAATGGTLAAGYLDHRVFVPVLNHEKIIHYKGNRLYRKAMDLLMRYPFATLVVTGFTPIPFFPFKFLCFSIHYPLWRYLTALSLARFPRYYLLAWIGAELGIDNRLLIASVVVIFGLYAVRGIPVVIRHFRERRRPRSPAGTVPETSAKEGAEEPPDRAAVGGESGRR